jgi:hypothetical protein
MKITFLSAYTQQFTQTTAKVQTKESHNFTIFLKMLWLIAVEVLPTKLTV